MARRRSRYDPVLERRRRMIVQAVVLTVLALVALVLVVMALRMP